AMFRTTFSQRAAIVLRAFMRCGVPCLDDFYSAGKGKPLQGGSIVVLHTHGRHGQYHPHLHVLATRGGYEAQGARWEHLQYLVCYRPACVKLDFRRPTVIGMT